jgi:hypothetical protein
LRAFRDYFATGDVEKDLVAELKTLSDKHALDFLILTVPDPVDSRFGFVFDELMAVLQRALEECDFVFDRAWLPWEFDKKKAEKEATTKILVDVLGRNGRRPADAEADEPALREKYPGVVLFRGRKPGEIQEWNKKPQPELFVVYLVGENPTSGIDKRAFTAALGMIESIQGSKKPNTADQPDIKIVGPYFTGSQSSLKRVLTAWQEGGHGDCGFDVMSGAASEIDSKRLLPEKGKSQFRATVIRTKPIRRAVLHYLERRNAASAVEECSKRPTSVAFLVEANTGFGRSVFDDINPKLGQEDKETDTFLTLPFPLHISGVAANFDKVRQLKDDQLGLPSFDSLIPRLGITALPNADLIAAQDPATTASVNGKVLADILAVINRKQIRYVGIVASDPRDTIFLAMSLREHCPGVQMFILGSDLLFCLPDFSYYLRGTIVGSTYPLLLANQRWISPKDKSRLAFPSDGAQGTYNAILAHLGNTEKLIEYRPPRLRQDTDTSAVRPPIWITMIGQNGELVPLQFFTNYADQDYLWTDGKADPSSTGETMQLLFPGTGVVALAGLCIFAGLVLACAFGLIPWRASGKVNAKEIDWWGMFFRLVCLAALAVLLFPVTILCALYNRNGGLADGRNLFIQPLLVVPFFFLGFVGPALVVPLVAGAKEPPQGGGALARIRWHVQCRTLVLAPLLGYAVWTLCSDLGKQFALVSMLLLPCAAGLLLLRRLPEDEDPQKRTARRDLWVPLALFLAAGILVWILYPYLMGPPDSGEAFLFVRSLDFSSGVTLLTPFVFLCAVYFAWAAFQMQERWEAQEFQVPNPYEQAGEGDEFEDVRKTGNTLCDDGKTLWQFAQKHAVVLLVLVCGLVGGTLQLWTSFMPLAEGEFWTWLFKGGLVVAGLLITFDLVRFFALWAGLKEVLQKIAHVRMVGAFTLLPPAIVRVFRGHLFPARVRESLLRVTEHQLRLLREETQRLLDENVPGEEIDVTDASALRGVINAIHDVMSTTIARADVHPRNEREELSNLAGNLLSQLKRFWPRHTLEDAFGPIDNDSARAEPKSSTVTRARTEAEPPGPFGRFSKWVGMAESFVAMQVVIYVSQFFVRLRGLVWAMVVCGLLLLLAATSYPFQPGRLILLSVLTLLGAVSGGILYVLYQINCDAIVSYTSGTTPNRFTPNLGFFSSVATYIGPVVGVVALQLTGAFRFVMEPILRLLK